MNNIKKENIPKPTWLFIIYIIMSIAFLLEGGFIFYLIFFSGQLHDVFFGAIALGFALLTAGVFFLVKVIKQIKARLSWNKEDNVEITERKLTTDEANAYQFMTAKPKYHDKAIDKTMGIKYEAKLKTDKYGNTYFKSRTSYGGFYYFGSLVVSFVITLIIISSIVDTIKNKSYVNIIIILIFLIIDFYFIKKCISEFREKQNAKKLIKKVKKQKEKIKAGTIIYRIILFSWLALIIILFFGYIMQEMGYPLSSEFFENIIKIIGTVFFGTIGIGLIYSVYIGIIAIIYLLKDEEDEKND